MAIELGGAGIANSIPNTRMSRSILASAQFPIGTFMLRSIPDLIGYWVFLARPSYPIFNNNSYNTLKILPSYESDYRHSKLESSLSSYLTDDIKRQHDSLEVEMKDVGQETSDQDHDSITISNFVS